MIGILGGMGPLATADFFAKLIQETPATTIMTKTKTLMAMRVRVAAEADQSTFSLGASAAGGGEKGPTLESRAGRRRFSMAASRRCRPCSRRAID